MHAVVRQKSQITSMKMKLLRKIENKNRTDRTCDRSGKKYET